MMKLVSVGRSPQIRERLHYIAEAVEFARENLNSHSLFELVKSPLYLIGKVYGQFEEDTEISGKFCLLQPDKFDETYRNTLELSFIKFKVPMENLKFIDM